jgi:hypothetical protein
MNIIEEQNRCLQLIAEVATTPFIRVKLSARFLSKYLKILVIASHV